MRDSLISVKRILAAVGVVLCLAWQIGPATAIFPFPPSNASYSNSVVCADTTPHVITAVGTGSVTAPSGCGHVTVFARGPGGSGATNTGGNGPGGGGGGAFAQSGPIAVTGGVTVVYYQNYDGGAAVSSNSTAGNDGLGASWINVGTNSSPASSSTGAAADYGRHGGTTSAGVAGSTANSIGGTLHNGGAGARYTTGGGATYQAGGGGGAGDSGDGGAGAGSGGTGGTGGTNGGGNGGKGGNSTTCAVAGSQPGGGGGAAQNADACSGKGGAGEVGYQFSAFLDLPPANDNLDLSQEAA